MGCVCFLAKLYSTYWPSDYLLIAQVCAFQGKVVKVKPTIHAYKPLSLLGWLYLKHVLDVMDSEFWVKVS